MNKYELKEILQSWIADMDEEGLEDLYDEYIGGGMKKLSDVALRSAKAGEAMRDVLLPTMNCDGWISVKDRLPKTIFQPYSDFEYSENVFAVCDGKLKILCLCYGKFETAEGEQYGYWWANCYGNIFCEHAEWDDDYQPTLWMPLPKLPETEVPTGKLRMWKGMRHKLGELSVRRSLLSKPLDVFEERLYQDLIDALRILDRLKITEEVNRG